MRVPFVTPAPAESRVIVADKPFNAIDDRAVADLVAFAHSWHAELRTVPAALHDASSHQLALAPE